MKSPNPQVYYIQYIKELPLKEARAAEMAVMTGHYQDAENMLLQATPTNPILSKYNRIYTKKKT